MKGRTKTGVFTAGKLHLDGEIVIIANTDSKRDVHILVRLDKDYCQRIADLVEDVMSKAAKSYGT